MTNPQIILLFSGKRKSGKDFICGKLKSILGEQTCTVIRISEPLKSLYANHHNLNLKELLSDGPYKEKYRIDMINWSEDIRATDSGYFCKAACDAAEVKPVWIVSDVRRITDVQWFMNTYDKIKTIRIHASLSTRENRGWIFTKGVDDIISECGLDEFKKWDLQINNNSEIDVENGIKQIVDIINSMC